MNFIERLKSTGPDAMVAAASTSLGTVTTASVTDARFGYALVWTIAFSIAVTIVLQEMNARLGLASREGLGEVLRGQLDSPVLSGLNTAPVVSATGVGTTAYRIGDILGGTAGLERLTGISANLQGLVMGLIAGVLLWPGEYRLIERALAGLVSITAVSFLIDVILINPGLGVLARGFIPNVPERSAFLVTGLIGATVVGYSLFLHAGSVQERQADPKELNELRVDMVPPIVLDGFITIPILVTVATALPVGTNTQNVSMTAEQLEPLISIQVKVFFGIGLFAAGFTSTAIVPLIGVYVMAGTLGWDTDLQSTESRAVRGSILLVGVVFPAVGYSPVQTTAFVQVANGILLPIAAVFLIYVMNDRNTLGSHASSILQNVIGGLATLVVVWLGLRTLYTTTTDMGVF